ncbi:hypothetical protein ACHAWF_007761 [Thalassiosira exigua]
MRIASLALLLSASSTTAASDSRRRPEAPERRPERHESPRHRAVPEHALRSNSAWGGTDAETKGGADMRVESQQEDEEGALPTRRERILRRRRRELNKDHQNHHHAGNGGKHRLNVETGYVLESEEKGREPRTRAHSIGSAGLHATKKEALELLNRQFGAPVGMQQVMPEFAEGMSLPAVTAATVANPCEFCPFGIPDSTLPLPVDDGSTCGDVANLVPPGSDADSEECETVRQLAEDFCCPPPPAEAPPESEEVAGPASPPEEPCPFCPDGVTATSPEEARICDEEAGLAAELEASSDDCQIKISLYAPVCCPAAVEDAVTEATPMNPIEPETTNPIEPEPANPVEIEPEPANPVEIQPEPTNPVEIQPEPANPVEIQPEPTNPIEIEPEPANPVEPEAVNPVEPEPTIPVEPEVLTPTDPPLPLDEGSDLASKAAKAKAGKKGGGKKGAVHTGAKASKSKAAKLFKEPGAFDAFDPKAQKVTTSNGKGKGSKQVREEDVGGLVEGLVGDGGKEVVDDNAGSMSMGGGGDGSQRRMEWGRRGEKERWHRWGRGVLGGRGQ